MIKTDSRKIDEGDTFIALKEATNDGHNYIDDAIKRGAKKIVAEDGVYDVETLIVNNTHEYLVTELDKIYKDELDKLKIIGITGTNGKTTSAFLIYQALNLLNIKCAYIGTIGFYKKDGKEKDLNNTTPDVLELYNMLTNCVTEDYKYVVMEVSSHALAKKRIGNLKFDYTIFTNLTNDHLDYHKTMNEYLNAKLKIISHLKDNGKSIVNLDDEYAKNFIKDNTITYGTNEEADYCFELTETTLMMTVFNLKYKNKLESFETKLIGKYNIYNLVSIMIILDDLDLLNKELIQNLEPPRGRMEKIKYNSSVIIIDYAHTPDATSNILKTIEELNPNHIYTVIGCGGSRDKTKRPIMASLATTYSDYVIFTTDNPRDEEPIDILNDMVNKLEKNNYEVEENREKAIIKGINKCQDKDILLILGKGHETYQLIKGIKYNFDDKKIVNKHINTV